MDFYTILPDEGKRKRFSFGIIVGEYPSRKINCTSCGREWIDDLLLEEKIAISICLSNNNYPDFLGVVYQHLISEKAKEVFEKEKVSGYHLRQVEILSGEQLPPQKKKELRNLGYKVQNISDNPPIYFRLFSNGIAELAPESEIVLVEHCPDCHYKLYVTPGDQYIDPNHPRYINKKSWKGEDLFMVKELGGRIFCTERFVEVYKKYKLTGLIFEKVESI